MFFTPLVKPVILLVDSDASELKTLKIGFELEGFEALVASTVSEMNAILASRPIGVALIDLMMPEINGLQIARTIRDSYPAVSTILMSAYHLSPLQLSRADTGAVGFVPKPFRFDTLVQFIRDKISTGVEEYRIPANGSSSIPGPALYSPFDVPEPA